MTSVHVICDLGPLPIKNPGYAYGYNGYLPPVTVTSDVINQFYFRLFFGLELVLVMIRVGVKFRLLINSISKTNSNYP